MESKAATLALALAILSGCGTSSSVRALLPASPPQPEIPADIQICFETVVGFPPVGELDSESNLRLILDLRASEIEKTLCGRRLLAITDALKESAN